jgi:hypothetical protein
MLVPRISEDCEFKNCASDLRQWLAALAFLTGRDFIV